MSDEGRNVNFRWSAAFVDAVDAARGDIPRSAYVRRALERHMAADDHPDARPATGAGAKPLILPDSRRFAVPRSPGLGKGPVAPRPKRQG